MLGCAAAALAAAALLLPVVRSLLTKARSTGAV